MNWQQPNREHRYKYTGDNGKMGNIYTTGVALIADNDETAYREEIRDLTVWCKDNNLSLNVIKTKRIIVDTGKGLQSTPPFSSMGLEWSRLRASISLVSTSPTN
jgi:hypothetical protein